MVMEETNDEIKCPVLSQLSYNVESVLHSLINQTHPVVPKIGRCQHRLLRQLAWYLRAHHWEIK